LAGPLIVATPAQRAVERAGSQTKLAEALGVTQQTVQQSVKKGYFPVIHAVRIENLFGIDKVSLMSPKHQAAFAEGKKLEEVAPEAVQRLPRKKRVNFVRNNLG